MDSCLSVALNLHKENHDGNYLDPSTVFEKIKEHLPGKYRDENAVYSLIIKGSISSYQNQTEYIKSAWKMESSQSFIKLVIDTIDNDNLCSLVSNTLKSENEKCIYHKGAIIVFPNLDDSE